MKLRPYRSASLTCAALPLLLVAACGGSSDLNVGDGGGESEADEIRLIEQAWEDLVVENQIVSQVLGELGYQTSIQEVSVPVGAEALARNDADVYLGNWWPSQEPVFEEYLDAGDVEVLGTLVTGTTYAPAVPAHVAEEYGVRSLADLAEHEDVFEGEFLGIEAGSPGNQYIVDAIDENAYELGGWTLVESSTAAMLAEVERRVGEEQPVVFLAWEPHWMNVEWDLVYLEDPDDVWPGAGEIRIATRGGFETDNPNVARFLSQMEIDLDTASEWIHQLSKEEIPAETIASEWISENSAEVNTWLEGVETVDGDPAEI